MGDIFDIIKDKANQHESAVPTDAWEQIVGRKRRRRPAAFWWIAASLLLITIGIGGYTWLNKQTAKKQAEQLTQQTKPSSSASDDVAPRTSGGSEASEQYVASSTIPTQASTKQDQPTTASAHISIDNTNPQTDQYYKVSAPKQSANPAQNNRRDRAGLVTSVHKKSGQKFVNPIFQSTDKGNASLVNQRNRKKKKIKADASIDIQNGGQSDLNPVAVSVTKQNEAKQDLSITSVSPETTTETPVVSTIPAAASIPAAPAVTPLESKKDPEPLTASVPSKKKEEKTSKKRTWAVEVAITPMGFVSAYDRQTVFHRLMLLNDGKTEFTGRMTKSEIKPTVSWSARLRKELNRSLSLGVGIEYLRANERVVISGAQVNTQYLIGQQHLNPGENPEWISDTIQSVSTQLGNIQSSNRYTVVSIPLSMQYRFWEKKKWDLALETGISLHVSTRYINHLNTTATSGIMNTRSAYANHTSLGFNINAGLRLGRRINDRVSVFALPYFGFNPVSQRIKNTMLDKHIHRAGVQLGASWKLW